MGKQHQEMDRPGVCQVSEGSGEQRKMRETGCEISCGAPTTLEVKELMVMMMLTSALTAVTCVAGDEGEAPASDSYRSTSLQPHPATCCHHAGPSHSQPSQGNATPTASSTV